MNRDHNSGILLHITSLPSLYGIGDLGPAAYRFADNLSHSDQHYWQILPLHPTSATFSHSPYHAISAFALNPLLISPELLVNEGMAEEHHLSCFPDVTGSGLDYTLVVPWKKQFLHLVATKAMFGHGDPDYERFCDENRHWLDDYALFSALVRHSASGWNTWPDNIRTRDPQAIARVQKALAETVEEEQYLQFLIRHQWSNLKAYARKHGVRIIGDMPMFVAYDSADVWSHQELFRLSSDGKPEVVTGVPPDYFSVTGQRWGNPMYRWEELERQGFSWWIERVVHALSLFDLLRIDHFRGFSACWEIPAESPTAISGNWVPTPGRAILSRLAARFSPLPLIAEDLGTITPDVEKLRKEFGLPGMRVLQFGFDGEPENPHALGNIPENAVFYTGTHDNNTIRGWFEKEADSEIRDRVASVFNGMPPSEGVARRLVELAMESPAFLVIVSAQDLLNLPAWARMNHPGTTVGNWTWRLPPGQPAEGDWVWLRSITRKSGRDKTSPLHAVE
jgi:4-alpha-glucanotransferase